jgi:hypothetical protein
MAAGSLLAQAALALGQLPLRFGQLGNVLHGHHGAHRLAA